MKVGIVPPTLIGHLQRGIGVYTNSLVDHLKKFEELKVVVSEYGKMPHEVDLIHFTYFDPFFLTLPLRRGQKTIVTIHDLIPLRFSEKFPRGLKGEVKWNLQKLALKSTNHIITDSVASKHDIFAFTGIPNDKISVVYLAPEDIFFETTQSTFKKNIQKKYDLPEKFILYVGDVNWNKNIPAVINAAEQTGLQFVIVSKTLKDETLSTNGWNQSAHDAQKKIAQLKNIKLIGFLEKKELVAFYQMATLLLYPSFYEGFGLPVVEAFAAQCPVITTHGGSLAEIAQDAACIVDPYRSEQITEAVQKVYTSTRLQDQLRVRGKKQVQKFSWRNTAAEALAIYKSVLYS